MARHALGLASSRVKQGACRHCGLEVLKVGGNTRDDSSQERIFWVILSGGTE